MSNVAKKIGKKSLIAAVILDLIGILISFLVNANLTNVVLLRIVLFCYCIRFELIAILIILVFFYFFFLFLKNARKVKPSLYLGLILFIIIAIVFSYRPIRQFVIARYYYFNNRLYEDESQKRFLDNATTQMNDYNWDLAIGNLSKANALYPNSYYSTTITNAIDEFNFYIAFGERLHETYIRPVTSRMPLNKYKCAQSLFYLYPIKYKREYLELRDSVVSAINAYPQLYNAFDNEDYEECRELIIRHGWCWFEPLVYDRLTSFNDSIFIERLNQYIGNEDSYSAQKRLVTNWVDSDSVSAIIK